VKFVVVVKDPIANSHFEAPRQVRVVSVDKQAHPTDHAFARGHYMNNQQGGQAPAPSGPSTAVAATLALSLRCPCTTQYSTPDSLPEVHCGIFFSLTSQKNSAPTTRPVTLRNRRRGRSP